MVEYYTLSGCSDDLIHITAYDENNKQVSGGEEWNFYGEDVFVCLSSGDIFEMRYADSGFWRINQIAKGSAVLSKHEGQDLDDDYSDIIHLAGHLEWAIVCPSTCYQKI